MKALRHRITSCMESRSWDFLFCLLPSSSNEERSSGRPPWSIKEMTHLRRKKKEGRAREDGEGQEFVPQGERGGGSYLMG